MRGRKSHLCAWQSTAVVEIASIFRGSSCLVSGAISTSRM